MSSQAGQQTDWRDEILTSREARELLKIGRTKLWELTRENIIPAYRVGKSKTSGLRYKRSELLVWLDKNRIRKEPGRS
jgi:excisionase family DNA binding protein